MERTVLEKAVEEYKPLIAKQCSDRIHYMFGKMVERLGPSLKGIYNDRTWGRTYSALMKNFVKADTKTSRMDEYEAADKYLNEDAVAAFSRRYADEVALSLLEKLEVKVGDLEDAAVNRMNADTFLVSGKKGNHQVKIEQTCVLNQSSLGTLYHQFPARIYVDGKFMSAAKFKVLT